MNRNSPAIPSCRSLSKVPAVRRLSREQRCRRLGLTLLETTVAAVLVAAAGVLTAQMAASSARQQRSIAQRQVALEEASNLLEALCSQSVAELDSLNQQDRPLSGAAAEMLPDGKLEIRVAAADDGDARRVEVRTLWQAPQGREPHSIKLVAWVHGAAPWQD